MRKIKPDGMFSLKEVVRLLMPGCGLLSGRNTEQPFAVCVAQLDDPAVNQMVEKPGQARDEKKAEQSGYHAIYRARGKLRRKKHEHPGRKTEEDQKMQEIKHKRNVAKKKKFFPCQKSLQPGGL